MSLVSSALNPPLGIPPISTFPSSSDRTGNVALPVLAEGSSWMSSNFLSLGRCGSAVSLIIPSESFAIGLPVLNITKATPEGSTLQQQARRSSALLVKSPEGESRGLVSPVITKEGKFFNLFVDQVSIDDTSSSEESDSMFSLGVDKGSSSDELDEKDETFLRMFEQNPTFAKEREMKNFKERCKISPRPLYEALQQEIEDRISLKDLPAAETAVSDSLEIRAPDEITSLHCALGLTLFPENSLLQGAAFALNIPQKDTWTLEGLSQWIPEIKTDGDFCQIGEILISYHKFNLAKQWIAKGPDMGVSSATIARLENQMERIAREIALQQETPRLAQQKLSEVIATIEECFSSVPPQEEKALAVIQAVKGIGRSSSTWGGVLKELDEIAQGSAWVLCRLRKKQTSVVFDIEPPHRR